MGIEWQTTTSKETLENIIHAGTENSVPQQSSQAGIWCREMGHGHTTTWQQEELDDAGVHFGQPLPTTETPVEMKLTTLQMPLVVVFFLSSQTTSFLILKEN